MKRERKAKGINKKKGEMKRIVTGEKGGRRERKSRMKNNRWRGKRKGELVCIWRGQEL